MKRWRAPPPANSRRRPAIVRPGSSRLGRFASSPGMVSESFTLVRATGLEKVAEGGGVPGEDIVVHRVALDDVPAFVAAKRDEGLAMDVKLLLLLGAGMLAASGGILPPRGAYLKLSA